MTKRVLLAGLLGGLAMYVWTAVAHMALPLGESGIKEIPNEDAVLSAMRSSMGDTSALYLFPGMGVPPMSMEQYGKKLASSPSGIVMYNPPGLQALSPRQFIAEFLKEVIEVLLAAMLLARTRMETYPSRLGFFALAGVLASIGTNVSYWNWYGFPPSYTIAYMLTQIVGFICAGLVAAAILKPAKG